MLWIMALGLVMASENTTVTCGPLELQARIQDGWIILSSIRNEWQPTDYSHEARVKIWGPWVHEASAAQLDDDLDDEFFVISRSTGTGPYYRLQIVDCRGEGTVAEVRLGISAWSVPSEGKPRIEGKTVLLGKIPEERWFSKGPPDWEPYRLTAEGLQPVSAEEP